MKAPFDLRVPRRDLPEPLRPWVQEYYETGLDIPPGETLRIPVSATTNPVMNVTYGCSIVIRIGRPFMIPPVTIAGPQPAAYTVEPAGQLRGFYIPFTPVGALALLAVEDYTLTDDGARPLHEMVRPALKEAAREWEEDLLNASGFDERVELSNRFLLAHRAEPDSRVRLLQAAVEAIDDAGGNLRIDDLARRLGVSPGTLRRHFAALGMSPKRFSSVLRFRRAHEYLSTTPGANWTDAVARFGYADQAHFVRDCRRFSGAPPTGWDPELRLIDRRMGIEGPSSGEV
jgi:AraC-like DNA-binding protein